MLSNMEFFCQVLVNGKKQNNSLQVGRHVACCVLYVARAGQGLRQQATFR